MKVSVDRAALAEALTWVARVVPKKPSVAALAGIRVTANDDQLALWATDYDTAHRVRLEAEVADDGEALLPGHFLTFAVAGGRGETTTLELADRAVTITSGRSTHKVRTLALDDYPDFPAFPDVKGVTHADTLARVFAAIAPAADDQNVYDNLAGVRLEAGELLECIGLDRPRIHVVRHPWDGDDFAATVHLGTFGAAVKGLGGDVEVGHDDALLGLRDGSREVTMRHITTPFANWRQALSHSEGQAKHKLTVDGTELLAAVRAAGNLVEAGGTIAVAYDGKGELSISAGQEAGEGEELLSAKGKTALSLRFDPKLLGEGIAATTGGEIELHYPGKSAKTAPLVVRDPAWDGLTVVVMTRSGGAS